MAIKDPARRYEINRKVKAVLSRHAVDMTELQYSTTVETVYLFGKLAKDPKGDFSQPQIETLIKDLVAISDVRDIQFDLTNWTVLYEPGFVSIRQRR
jgi:hypothetical protein